MKTQSCYFPSSGCRKLVGFLGCLLTDVDEVARGLGLAGDVLLEISVDAVLHFAEEGFLQQPCEALQTMRVVRQTEFTAEEKQERAHIRIPPTTKKYFLLCLMRLVRESTFLRSGKQPRLRDNILV